MTKGPRKSGGGRQAAESAPLGQGPEAATGPGAGHNLTDDQRRYLFLQGLGQIEALQAQVKSIVSKIQHVRKTMKAEGTAKEEIDYALFLRRVEHDEAVKQYRDMARIARWLAHPVGSQPDLFTSAEGREHPVDGPFEQGKTVGLAGRPMDEALGKWQPGSPEGQKAIEGWHAGQAILAEGIQQKADETAPIVGRGKGMPGARPKPANDEAGDEGDGPKLH